MKSNRMTLSVWWSSCYTIGMHYHQIKKWGNWSRRRAELVTTSTISEEGALVTSQMAVSLWGSN